MPDEEVFLIACVLRTKGDPSFVKGMLKWFGTQVGDNSDFVGEKPYKKMKNKHEHD